MCGLMVTVTWEMLFSGFSGGREPCRQLCTSHVSLRVPQPFTKGRLAQRMCCALELELAFQIMKRTQDAELMTGKGQ